MDIYHNIGQKLQKARKEKGIGQKVLASLLGYTTSTISQYEKGNRCILLTDLERIANHLNLPLGFFISNNGEGGKTTDKGINVSLKQFKTMQEAGRLKRKSNDLERELTDQKNKNKKMEKKILNLMGTVSEQARVTNQAAQLYKELKSNQETIKKAEKISAAHRTARDIAYKINNPLTSLLGFIQVISSELPSIQFGSRFPSVNRTTRVNLEEDINRLEKNTRRCIKIVNNMLSTFTPPPFFP